MANKRGGRAGGSGGTLGSSKGSMRWKFSQLGGNMYGASIGLIQEFYPSNPLGSQAMTSPDGFVDRSDGFAVLRSDGSKIIRFA